MGVGGIPKPSRAQMASCTSKSPWSGPTVEVQSTDLDGVCVLVDVMERAFGRRP